MTPVYWVARQLAIPLQTSQSPGGIFTPQDLGTLLSQISAYVYYKSVNLFCPTEIPPGTDSPKRIYSFDTPSGFKLRQVSYSVLRLFTPYS